MTKKEQLEKDRTAGWIEITPEQRGIVEDVPLMCVIPDKNIIKITIEVELNSYYRCNEEKKWLEDDILIGDGSLILHSNEIGDEIGVITKSVVKKWIR